MVKETFNKQLKQLYVVIGILCDKAPSTVSEWDITVMNTDPWSVTDRQM